MHIDWLSWTLETKREPRTHAELYDIAKQHLMEVDRDAIHIVFDGQGFEPSKARAPYRVAVARNDGGARLYGDSHTGTVLFELSGRGCEVLRGEDMARWFVANISERITRIDFAVDVRCDTLPSDFANDRDTHHFRSVGFVKSASGETVYSGSPKSDRYARIYRYNPPHPRHKLLRVEFVFRRSLAKAAARSYVEAQSTETYITQLGNTWGLAHRVWKPGVRTDERLRAPIVERRDQDTLSWLYAQVVPAMRRLVKSGALDMTDFLTEVYDTRE